MRHNYILILLVSLLCGCSNPEINGIDISHHNKVEWSKLPENIEFVYIKATEGGDYRDKMFTKHAKQAITKGLHVGAYHYFRTNVSGEKQFENFSKALDKIKFDLIPVIDVEEKGNVFTKESDRELEVLISLLAEKYGTRPIVYYGSISALSTITSTYDCKLWMRTMEYSKFVPDFSIRQIGYIPIDNQIIDGNYCSDINRIILDSRDSLN